MNIPPETWNGSFAHRLGMEYGDNAPGSAEAVLEVGAHHCNPNGVCHGGAIFTLSDDSMGAALHPLCAEGQVPAATQVGIHFVRSARPGDRLQANAQVLSQGRRTALVESRVTDAEDRLVAVVTGSFLFVETR